MDGSRRSSARTGGEATVAAVALPLDFSAEELVTVDTVVTVANTRLYDILTGLIRAVNAGQATSAAAERRVQDLERRADNCEATLRQVAPDADEEAARERRIDDIESALAKAQSDIDGERGERLRAFGLQRDRDDEVQRTLDITAARMSEVEAGLRSAEETADDVRRLREQLAVLDSEARRLSNQHEEAQRRLGDWQKAAGRDIGNMYAVLETTPDAVQGAVDAARSPLIADDDEDVGLGPRAEHLLSLPAFAALQKQQQDQLDRQKKQLQEDIRVTRVQIVDKQNRKEYVAWKTQVDEHLERLRGDIEHERGKMAGLEDLREALDKLQRQLRDLSTAKADKGDILDKADRSEVSNVCLRLDELRADITSLWERLDTFKQGGGGGGGGGRAPSRGGPPQREGSFSMNNTLEALKLRVADLENNQHAHGTELARLAEVKMDKRELREIYAFLDKVTKKVDCLGGGGAYAPPPSAAAAEPPAAAGVPLHPQRPARPSTAPAQRPSRAGAAPAAPPAGQRWPEEDPPPRMSEQGVRRDPPPAGGSSTPRRDTSRSPARARSPKYGNTRWGGGGSQFVHSSAGVICTSATRTAGPA